MRAILSVLNQVKNIKGASNISRSLLSAPILSAKPAVVTDAVSLDRSVKQALNAVKDFGAFTPRYQNAIKNNSQDIKIIYDLYEANQITKSESYKRIFQILNNEYCFPKVPNVEEGLRGSYGEYNEWLNKIKINEGMNLDEIISHYSHEIHHYSQAIDKRRAIPSEVLCRAKAISEVKRSTFVTSAKYENTISKRTQELLQLEKEAGWREITQNYTKYKEGTKEFEHAIDMHNADVQSYDMFGNLQEMEAYTAGTSTFIELQKSVHNSISKVEYDILNEINIVLHESYHELPEVYQRLAKRINVNPREFVDNVRYIVRELGIKNTDEVTDCLVQLL